MDSNKILCCSNYNIKSFLNVKDLKKLEKSWDFEKERNFFITPFSVLNIIGSFIANFTFENWFLCSSEFFYLQNTNSVLSLRFWKLVFWTFLFVNINIVYILVLSYCTRPFKLKKKTILTFWVWWLIFLSVTFIFVKFKIKIVVF